LHLTGPDVLFVDVLLKNNRHNKVLAPARFNDGLHKDALVPFGRIYLAKSYMLRI